MAVTRRQFVQLGALVVGLPAAGCSSPSQHPAPARATSPSPGTATGPAAATPTEPPTGKPTSPRPGDPAREVGSGPRTGKAVALTFHGAGDDTIARAVLSELAKARAPATVLAVGSWLDGDPTAARRVLDGGHELGNHTQNHKPMRLMSQARAYAEIVGCASTLRRLIGDPGRWFRASGTQHTTPAIRAAAGRAGYAQCLSYDVDSLDYTDPGTGAVVRNVMSAVRGGSIISLHLGHRDTVAAIAPLVDGLRAHGLAPVTVSALLG